MKTLNEENFEAEVLESDRMQVVMFYRETGCANCEQMRPRFEAFAAKATDVDCGMYLCEGPKPDSVTSKYGFRTFPGFYYFADGKVVGQLEGAFPEDLLAMPLASDAEIKAAGFDHAEMAGTLERAKLARFVFDAAKRTLGLRARAAEAPAEE